MTTVLYDFDSFGYTLKITGTDDVPVDLGFEQVGDESYEYSAGNSHLESTTVVSSSDGVGRRQLGKWARKQSREAAEQLEAKVCKDGSLRETNRQWRKNC